MYLLMVGQERLTTEIDVVGGGHRDITLLLHRHYFVITQTLLCYYTDFTLLLHRHSARDCAHLIVAGM